MGGEEWRQMTRGGRRGGRASGHAGGVTKPPLAGWCDANLPATRFVKLAYLVQTQKATAAVVAILKKFQKQATPLSKVQQGILEKELDGAGEWGTAAAPAAPTRSMATGAGAAKGPATRVSPASRGRAGTVPAPVEASRPRRRARRAAGTMAPAEESVAEAGTCHAEVEAKDAEMVWTCQECSTPHRYGGRLCKVCKANRVTTAEVAATLAAGSAEDMATRAANIQMAVDAMMGIGAKTAVIQTAIDEMMTQIEQLKKPAAPAPQPSLPAQLQDAARAVEAAQKRTSDLTALLQSTQVKIEQHVVVRESLGRALELALKTHQAAEAGYAAVMQAGAAPTPNSGPAAAPAASAAPAPASIAVAVAKQVEALNAPDAEMRVRQSMSDCASSWGCTVHQDFPMAKFMAEFLRAGLLAPAAAQSTAAQPHLAAPAATAPTTPKAPAARVTAAPMAAGAVGGALLEARPPHKVESMAKQSEAQSAKTAHGEVQRGEKREAAFAAGRREPEAGEAENKAAFEAGDAGDPSGDGSSM